MALVALSACAAPTGPLRPGTGAGPRELCDPGPLPARIRRLTAEELRAAAADLLGPELGPPPHGLGPDPRTDGYDNDPEALVVTEHFGEQWLAAVEHYAARAELDRWACPGPAPPPACVGAAVRDLAGRAFRRAPTDAEVEGLLAVYATAADEGHRAALELVVQAALMSPSFLYRTELGPPAREPSTAADVELTADEVAVALAFLVTGHPPDAALRALAHDGSLASPDVRAREVRRLFAAGERRQVALLRQWLGVGELGPMPKDPATYPSYNGALRASMEHDLDAFLAHVVADGGSYEELMTSPVAYVDDALAAVYGLAPGPAYDPSRATRLPPGERSGVLTRAAVLARYAHPDGSSPVQRGAFVLRRLLCAELDDPPAGVTTDLPAPVAGTTTRDRVAAHSASAACRGCHARIDPIGFGLEAYDGLGRYRTAEGEAPIDDAGAIQEPVDAAGPFRGGVELAARMATSADARACFAREAGRYLEARYDGSCPAAVEGIDVAAGDVGLLDVLIATVRDPRFVRRAWPGEAP